MSSLTSRHELLLSLEYLAPEPSISPQSPAKEFATNPSEYDRGQGSIMGNNLYRRSRLGVSFERWLELREVVKNLDVVICDG